MKSDVVEFFDSNRYLFTSIMREMISRGFIWNPCMIKETRETGIKGYFIKSYPSNGDNQ